MSEESRLPFKYGDFGKELSKRRPPDPDARALHTMRKRPTTRPIWTICDFRVLLHAI